MGETIMRIQHHIIMHEGNGSTNRKDAFCGVSIYHTGDDIAVVVLTELPDNPGSSVTSCVERIATRVYHAFLRTIEPASIIWVEHNPARPGGIKETFDVVSLAWTNSGYANKGWRSLGKEGFQQLFGNFDGAKRVKIHAFPPIRMLLSGR